jgi:hypothetical protein
MHSLSMKILAVIIYSGPCQDTRRNPCLIMIGMRGIFVILSKVYTNISIIVV